MGPKEVVNSDPKRPPESRPNTRLLVDVHVHAGAPEGSEAIRKEIRSPKDWALVRSTQPELFAEVMSHNQVDNSDVLIGKMDEKGVTHAIIQLTPGRGSTNKRIADMARRHKGRLFPIYRPEFWAGAVASGKTKQKPDKEVFSRNAQRIAEDIESLFPALGLIGVGEVIPGGLVTGSIDPVEISQNMSPIMEALGPGNLPIQIPTGWTGWKGGLNYTYHPIWVDELAGDFPDVPIVLTKMGRGFRSSFDECMVVAMRNANVYIDMTESPSEHVREALQSIGPERIMFGVDLSAVSLNYAYEHGFRELKVAEPNAEELEWIAWRSVNEVYQLGLEA